MAVKIIPEKLADKIMKAGSNTKDEPLKEFVSDCGEKKDNKKKKEIIGEFQDAKGGKISGVTKEKEKVILKITTRTNVTTGSIINLYDSKDSPFLFSIDEEGKQLITISDRLFIEVSDSAIPLYINFQD